MNAAEILTWILETEFIDIIDSRTEDTKTLETIEEIKKAIKNQ